MRRNDDNTPGGVPMMSMPGSGSQTYHLHQQAPQSDRPGPKTWQVIIGFIAAAGVIAGGVLTVADRIYLDKETYRKEREIDVTQRTELKAAVNRSNETTSELNKNVKELNEKLQTLNLTEPNQPNLRRYPRGRPPQ